MSWVKNWRGLLATRSFRQPMRLTGLFLAVFVVVLVGAAGMAIRFIDDHIANLLQRDIAIERLYGAERDSASLADDLRLRESASVGTIRKRLVLDPSGRMVYGDPALAPFARASSDGVTVAGGIRAISFRLADGGRFVNAYDLHGLWRDFLILPLVAAGTVLTLLLTALVFSFAYSAATLRRVSAITAALSAYAAGDRERRVAIESGDDEFARLGREVNRTLERVGRLVEEVSSVSSNIAHEVRTPLTRLHNRLASALDLCRDEDIRQELEESIEETRRVDALFRLIMRLGEIETGRCALSVVPLDAASLLEEIAEYFAPMAEERGVALMVQADPQVVPQGDRALLFQAIANVVDNALKYAPDSGAVTLSCTARDGWCEIAVGDRGRGLPPGHRALAVQRFCRLEPSGRTPGHGLGLALVRAIATLHGGELRLEDNQPGLRVVIRLSRTGGLLKTN